MLKQISHPYAARHSGESGNVMFFILLAIALIALVTAAIRSGGIHGANVDKEEVLLSASRIKQYASELERGAVFILTSGESEEDIRFAHPEAPVDYGNVNTTPSRQLFHPQGGGAEYRDPPGGANDGSPWEFYGHTHVPDVGSSRAELIAVLPNVTDEICNKINEMNDLGSTPPQDTGAAQTDCVYGGDTLRFDDGTQYSGTPNTTNEASFAATPVPEACVTCDVGGNHFYHVLHAR